MHKNGQPKPKSDTRASAAFQRWKDANQPISDGEIAQVVRCTSGSVVNWRKGTRPDARFLPKLEALIGFKWDSPPAQKDPVGRMLTDVEKANFKSLSPVSVEERQLNRGKPVVAEPVVAEPVAKVKVAEPVAKVKVALFPSLSEDVDLLVARGTFASALSGGDTLDLSVPSVAAAVRVAQRLIEREFDGRKAEPKMLYLQDVLPIVLGHRDPLGTLEALRRLNIGNVESSVWDAIGNLIEPAAVSATAK